MRLILSGLAVVLAISPAPSLAMQSSWTFFADEELCALIRSSDDARVSLGVDVYDGPFIEIKTDFLKPYYTKDPVSAELRSADGKTLYKAAKGSRERSGSINVSFDLTPDQQLTLRKLGRAFLYFPDQRIGQIVDLQMTSSDASQAAVCANNYN